MHKIMITLTGAMAKLEASRIAVRANDRGAKDVSVTFNKDGSISISYYED